MAIVGSCRSSSGSSRATARRLPSSAPTRSRTVRRDGSGRGCSGTTSRPGPSCARPVPGGAARPSASSCGPSASRRRTDTPRMPGLIDAIVVGGGPNGLAAAIELAREGHSVDLIEAAATVGGGARSDERTLPGFVHDACSAIYPFGRIAPFFAGGWLERRGVRWIEPPIAVGHPLDDGTAVILRRDVGDTAAELGKDDDEYRRLFGPLVDHFDELLPDILAPFHVPLWPPRAARLAWFGIQALQPVSWLVHRFVEGRAKALLAGAAVHAILPLDAPVSGAAALLMLGS